MTGKCTLQYHKYEILEGCNQKDDAAFLNGCLLGRQERSDSGSKEDNGDFVNKQVNWYANGVRSWRKDDELSQQGVFQVFAGAQKKDDEYRSEDSGMQGWEMDTQRPIIPHD